MSHDPEVIAKAVAAVHLLESQSADPSVEEYVRAVLDAVADDLRAAAYDDGYGMAVSDYGCDVPFQVGPGLIPLYNPYRKEADRG